MLGFVGYRIIIARYVAKWGIAQMCLCKIKHQGGYRTILGGVLTSLKRYRAIWGIAAIVSQYRAMWGHNGYIGNGRNTVSRELFRKRELTEFSGKLGEFCEKLGEFALAHK